MKQYDYLIVGAGLFGCVCAWRLKQAGKRCLVIEKRTHTGGNVHCETIEGIDVHQYGAHIFHTSNREVWEFVSKLVEMNRYTNCPIANYKGKLYNLPFNMNTFAQMWGVSTPAEAKAKLEQQRSAVLEQLGGRNPQNLEEQALSLVGEDIYERLIKGYTEKQWGRTCRELPAFIIRRLPLRFVFDNNYFNDTWQGIPIGGYNRLTDKLLEGIEVRTGVDFLDNRTELSALADKVLYTGSIDAFFDYCYGHLEYRSVRFETEQKDTYNYQGNAVINYTSTDVPYTRIIEHKHFALFGEEELKRIPTTIISKEYSVEWQAGMEPYYPVNNETNDALYGKYRKLAGSRPDVVFGGRLAEYRYYDMDDIIEKALGMEL
ncbi:MAG: UDP-galactopyranose mutase [Paludibacter sp.]|nr:UDP-galactopyranose mutase [Bacteroidales bacterium]MCM1069216.1 UDP-galactopyranose mutase [Prevotella sp.]MCM1354364.1 UDP-galactopyranose mutase [Bacteroides sp.]MCM1443176.1 UDP-galactopyranose mutase [Muribaculum sp.]MCM1481771.1 UDP-galactopyranose mutase [Paludibacter sp.]